MEQYTISFISLSVSIVAITVTLIQNRKIAAENLQLNKADSFIYRNIEVEGKLADWPEAFQLFGVDIDEALEEGISHKQIAFLVISVDAFISYCRIGDRSVYNELMDSTYRRKMFVHKKTRRTWKYAREVMSDDTVKAVDMYIKDKYGETYESNIEKHR